MPAKANCKSALNKGIQHAEGNLRIINGTFFVCFFELDKAGGRVVFFFTKLSITFFEMRLNRLIPHKKNFWQASESCQK